MNRLEEKTLKKYNVWIKVIERKSKQIEELNTKEVDIVTGKVSGSSKYFPYLTERTTVQMYDPGQLQVLNDRVKKYSSEIEEANKKIEEIENFINSISDPELKLIFELRVYKEMNWVDIAAELSNMSGEGEIYKERDRTTYSKKFKKYLINSHNSHNSQN